LARARHAHIAALNERFEKISVCVSNDGVEIRIVIKQKMINTCWPVSNNAISIGRTSPSKLITILCLSLLKQARLGMEVKYKILDAIYASLVKQRGF